MKRKGIIFSLSIICILLATSSCELFTGELEYAKVPKLKREVLLDIGTTGVTITAEIFDVPDDGLTDHGFCYSTNPNPRIGDPNSKTISLGATSKEGPFHVEIQDLAPKTRYYVAPFITFDGGKETKYGEDIPIDMEPLEFSVLNPEEGEAYTKNTDINIQWHSNFNDALKLELINKGILEQLIIDNVENQKSYTWNIPNNVNYGNNYQIKITSNNNEAIFAYSNIFTILGEAAPNVSTGVIVNLSYFTATVSGSIHDFGSETSGTAHGHCWSTGTEPSISGDKTTTPGASTIGVYTSEITGLAAQQTYYIRAYATNSIGTSYGKEVSITTPAAGLAILSTETISSVGSTTAVSGGNVIHENGAAVTARGVCWSTAPYPTLSNDFSTDGSGEGVYSSSISGLTKSTTYYIRAYATSSVGTAYGDEYSFTTLTLP